MSCAVILASAVADRHSRERGRELGAVAFHQKPFTLDRLLSDLQAAAAGHPPPRALS